MCGGESIRASAQITKAPRRHYDKQIRLNSSSSIDAAGERSDAPFQVYSGCGLKPLPERRQAIDHRSVTEPFQNSSPADAECEARDVGILTPDALLEGIEFSSTRAENRQIDVYDQPRVRALCLVGSSCQNVGSDAIGNSRQKSELAKARPRQGGAALLVVVGAWIVDRVVKPEGESDLPRVLCKAGEAAQPSKARRHVVDGMVVTMGLAVARDEFIEHGISRAACPRCSESVLKLSSKLDRAHVVSHAPSVLRVFWILNQTMGRPSNREERRNEILRAFARVLADHGFAGATITSIAAEPGVAPGLVHHHFESKGELLSGLLTDLVAKFRTRVHHYQSGGDPLLAYFDAALKLDDRADVSAARCWVGVFAEAIRNPALFAQMRRLIDAEIVAIQRRSGDRFSPQQAGAVLAFVIGALVVGAFAPRKTAGFAAPGLKRLVAALRADSAGSH